METDNKKVIGNVLSDFNTYSRTSVTKQHGTEWKKSYHKDPGNRIEALRVIHRILNKDPKKCTG